MEFTNIIKRFFGINQESNPFRGKDYLLQIYRQLEIAKDKQKSVCFTIEKIINVGYQVKVNGVNGVIHFRQMPWKYANLKNWATIFPLIKGFAFVGKISELSVSEKISVLLDATASQVSKPILEEEIPYTCIVLHKLNYGLILELGSHFKWGSGSITGFAHKSSFIIESEFENAKIGDQITTYFQGMKQGDKIIMGDQCEDKEWVTHEMDKFLGTTQNVRIVKNETGIIQFYFNDIQCVLSASKNDYPDHHILIRKYLRTRSVDDEIKCDIARIIYAKKKFEVKINDDFLYKLIEENAGEINICQYVRTTHKIKMQVKNRVKARYLLNDTIECVLPLTLKYYPINKKEVIEYISDGEDKEIECKVVGIKKATKQPILRLTNDLIAEILDKKILNK